MSIKRLGAFALVGALASPLSAFADIAGGINWLATQPNANGSFGSTPASLATPVQTSAEVLRAYRVTGQTAQPPYAPAIVFLNGDTETNTEFLARKIVVNVGAGNDVTAMINALVANQNSDGGFGDQPGYESSAFDTAYALTALAAAGRTSDPAAQWALSYLLSIQGGDGGFSAGEDEPSVYLSALASIAMQPFAATTAVQDAINRANTWLLNRQLADAGWGDIPGSSLAALATLGTTTDPAFQSRVLSYLLSQQLADGSWAGDAFSTALALQALVATPGAPAPQTGGLTGRIRDATTLQAIAGGAVEITGGANTVSDTLGGFALSNIPVGNYTVTVSVAGYVPRSYQVTLVTDTVTDIGDVLMAPVTNTGSLQGTITDAASGSPLADVTVAVTGSFTGSTQTASNGTFRFVGLPPGAVTVTASRSGYDSVSGTGTIVAGGVLVFSPALKLTGESAPQTGTVQGQIRSAATGLPLAGVTIAVTGASSAATVTDPSGNYQLPNILPGAITVTASFAGYDTATGAGTILAGGVVTFSPNLTLSSAGDPQTSTLRGRVTDAVSGAPLADATITVTGAASGVTRSGTDGVYQLGGLSPGSVTVSVAHGGYDTVVGAGLLTGGGTLTFDARLQPSGLGDVPVGSIVGQVIDAITREPLPGVTVTVAGEFAATATTNSLGQFEIHNMPARSYTVSLALAGYFQRSLPTLVPEAGVADLGTQGLTKATSAVVVFGRISDSGSGDPIPQATVAVAGQASSAMTDASGNYRLEGLDLGLTTLRFSAPGYVSETLAYNFGVSAEYRLDRRLARNDAGEIQVISLQADAASYRAHGPVTIDTVVQNKGTSPTSALIAFGITDASGRLVHSAYANGAGGGSVMELVPGVPVSARLVWDTAAYPPGIYSASVKVLRSDTAATIGPILLAERATSFEIIPWSRIASLAVIPLPRFTHIGATEQVVFLAELVNRSNTSTDTEIAYEWRSPSGQLLQTGTRRIAVAAQEFSKSVLLFGTPFTFSESGEHLLSIQVLSGTVPQLLTGGAIAVAPTVRIDPSQSATPSTVVPDGDKRIRIEIRLQGVAQ